MLSFVHVCRLVFAVGQLFVVAQQQVDVVDFVSPSECLVPKKTTGAEYFSPITMKCEPCEEPSSGSTHNTLACPCGVRSKEAVLSLEDGKYCELCSAGTYKSLDGHDCVECFNNTMNCGTCPDNHIPVETHLNGSKLRKPFGEPMRLCIPCASGTKKTKDGLQCEPCYKNIQYGFLPTSCDCPAEQEAGEYCFSTDTMRKSIVRDPKQPYTIYPQLGSKSDPLVSLYYKENALLSYILCGFYKSLDACQQLANLCVLSLYEGGHSDARDDNVCAFYSRLQSSQSSTNPVNGETQLPRLPEIFYPIATNVKSVLRDTSLDHKFTFSGTNSSKLNLVVARYMLNGTFIGITPVTDGLLQLCKASNKILNAAYRFGTFFQLKCEVRASDLWKHGLELHDLYLEFSTNQQKKLHSIPILIRNFDVNREQNSENWELVRRFFLVDNISFRNKDGEVAEYLRFASSMHLYVSLQRDSKSGLIYTPYLAVDYKTVSKTDYYDSNRQIPIEFQVSYTMDYESYKKNVRISLGVLGSFAIVYGIFRSWVWSKRSGRLAIDCSVLLQFVLFSCAALANAFFVVAYGAAVWWLSFFKKQDNVYVLLPTGSVVFTAYIIAAFVMKALQVLHLTYTQTTVDIFLMDWEKPKNWVTMQAGEQTTKEAPISIWRTYFVANEWNEIQTCRKISKLVQLFSVLFFLKVVGLEYSCTQDPLNRLSLKPDEYYAPQSTILRFAMATSILLVTGALQWLFVKFVYERFISNAVEDFVDLCGWANVSLLIMPQEQFGYYIHGKSVHNMADTNLLEMFKNFRKEEEPSARSKRGIPGTDHSTFIATMPVVLRTLYVDAMGATIAAQTVQTAGRSTSSPLEAQREEALVQGYNSINKTFQSFIEHSNPLCDFEVRGKRFIENILDCEFDDSTNKGIFYMDNGHAFDEVLFAGNETTLFLFEVLLFAIVDLVTHNFVLAAIITYLVSEVIAYWRGSVAKRNLARKTLVDERFLI